MKQVIPNLVVANVRLPTGRPAHLLVCQGKVHRFVSSFHGPALDKIDARGALILPGFIDAHVHLNEPGRTHWEGLASGTRALAAGGVTTFFDMPLNSSPPCLSPAQLETKRALARKKSIIDFGLWGGLVPGNEDQIPALAQAGAIGIKTFLCPSGLPDFPATDLKTLRQGAKACARAGLVLGVHAEDPETMAQAARHLPPELKNGWRQFVRSRPESAEVAAIRHCLAVAEETQCAFHIVHVSAPEGLLLIAQAARRGLHVSAETCPHHLLLDPRLMETLGGRAKCAPPLRPRLTRAALWRHLAAGRVHTIGSDHSPCPPRLKEIPDFAKVWGGIHSAQYSMLLFLQAARRRGLPWPLIIKLTSQNTATRFALKNKQGLRAGADADFVLLRPTKPYPLRAEDSVARYPLSPYLGGLANWRIEATFVRGQPVFAHAQFAQPGQAQEVSRL